MKKTQKWLGLLLPVVIAAGLIFTANFAAVKYCVENINVFAAMTLIVPVVIVAAAAFAEGVQIKWNWKKGLCIALILTLVSFGIERMVVTVSGNQLSDLTSGVMPSSGQPSDELMDELYDELDRKAYEYMLEHGLISEGDEILGGDRISPNQNQSGNNNNSDNGGLRGETYVGIQAADPTTELLGNLLTMLIAFGASFAGSKVRNRKSAA
jgi:hypothetical protein